MLHVYVTCVRGVEHMCAFRRVVVKDFWKPFKSIVLQSCFKLTENLEPILGLDYYIINYMHYGPTINNIQIRNDKNENHLYKTNKNIFLL